MAMNERYMFIYEETLNSEGKILVWERVFVRVPNSREYENGVLDNGDNWNPVEAFLFNAEKTKEANGGIFP